MVANFTYLLLLLVRVMVSKGDTHLRPTSSQHNYSSHNKRINIIKTFYFFYTRTDQSNVKKRQCSHLNQLFLFVHVLCNLCVCVCVCVCVLSVNSHSILILNLLGILIAGSQNDGYPYKLIRVITIWNSSRQPITSLIKRHIFSFITVEMMIKSYLPLCCWLSS